MGDGLPEFRPCQGTQLSPLEKCGDHGARAPSFALGHLAHVAGDASAEVFVTPTVFASAPIGPMDLFIGNDKPKSESEAIVEGYGDLVNGDWEAVVETIWDLRLESPEAWGRFANVFLWYCETGNELFNNSDCEAALTQLDERFGTADDLLGGLDLDGAKNLIQALVNQPLETLFDLYSSGLLAFLLRSGIHPGDNYDFYAALSCGAPGRPCSVVHLRHGPADLGPVFTVDHYENEILGWPEYDGVSLISGNIQSLLQYLPEAYSAQPGLHVTELRWFNSGGSRNRSGHSRDGGPNPDRTDSPLLRLAVCGVSLCPRTEGMHRG